MLLQGRKFSIKGLLGEEVAANDFEGGSIAIFRLAPQVLILILFKKAFVLMLLSY